MPQLPFHRYIGPGNPVDHGIPIDEDDRIAALHDIRYHNASSSEDIRSADREAIGLFAGDYARTSNWHSLVGALGITGKYLFESVAGVQYPRSTTGPGAYGTHVDTQYQNVLQYGNTQGSGSEFQPQDSSVQSTSNLDTPPSTPQKRRRMDQEEEMLQDSPSTTGNVQKGGGTGAPITPGFIHRPITNFKTGKLSFMHSRIMYSYGYQFKSILATEKLENAGKQLLVCTPYARVPCHGLPFYLTKAEFNNLPIGSEGKRFITVVKPLGFRTPFITNSAGINSVNSSLLVHGVYAHGLNNKYGGTNMSYKSTAADPMIITQTTRPTNDGIVTNDLWGKQMKKTDTTLDFNDIPACFGNKKPLQTYYVQNVDVADGVDSLPDLMQDINIYTMGNGIGNPDISWEYRPQVCVLKCSEPYPFFRNQRQGTTGNTTNVLYGSKVPFSQLARITVGDDHSTISFNETESLLKRSVDVQYSTSIEQSGCIMHGLNEYGGGTQPPTLHVGVLPVNAYSTDAVETKVQEVIAMYKIDTICEIDYSFDFTHPHTSYVHPVMKVMGSTSKVDTTSQDYAGDFAYGYRSTVPVTTAT